MKKFFAIAALAVASLTANAQAWLGGNIGYTSTTNKIETNYYSTDATSSNFSFAPEVGYDLDETWSVALRLSYAHTDSYSVKLNNTTFSGKANSFAINPYVRYKFFNEGNFTVFVDGGITYGTTHINGYSDVIENPNFFNIGFNPGIAYAISDDVTLVAHFGDLSYNITTTKAKRYDVKSTISAFNIGLDNSISFGVYVAL